MRKQLGGEMKSLAINSVRCTIGAMLAMWLSRPLRSFVSLATLIGAVVVGGCSYQLNSLAPKSGADTEQTGFTDRPQPPEVDLAYARAVAANAFTHGGKDKNIPWQNPNTGAGGNITPLASSYVEGAFTCQDFLASYVHGKTEAWLQGEACRTDHSKWEVKSLRPLNGG